MHEYGGAAVSTSSPDGSIIFNDGTSDGIFLRSPSGEVKEIIAGAPDSKLRYADFDVHPKDHGIIAAVQEEHRGKEVINTIAVIDANTKKATTIVEGADFYSHPKFSPDGKRISYLTWDHPDMPWTGSELYVAEWDGTRAGKPIKIAGQARTESVSQPKWHDENTLLFCSDRTGFSQLYRSDGKSSKVEHLTLKGLEEAEIGGREFILGW